MTPVFAGYGKAKVTPAAEVGKQITPEVLEEEKSLSEEEYEKFEKRSIKEYPDLVLPSIVYPVQLENYRLPCELGSYIFWNSFLQSELTIDCEKIGIPGGEQILNLCSYSDAVEYIAQKGLAKKTNPHSGSDSDREESVEFELPIVTLSVMQLCRKLKKMNHRFHFEFINESDHMGENVVDIAEDAKISPAKVQRNFVEDMVTDIYENAS